MTNINDEFINELGELHLVTAFGGAVSAATLIAGVEDIPDIEKMRAIAEYKGYGDSLPKKKKGSYELGDFEFKVFWRPGDTGHAALMAEVDSDDETYLTIVFRDGSENARIDLGGLMKGWKVTPSLDDVQRASFPLALTANPVIDDTTDIALNY